LTDADLLLPLSDLQYGSGIVGVCDVCGKRQAVIVLQKERFKLCVLDFLNKKWIGSKAIPSMPAPIYRSERVFFPTSAAKSERAPAVVLSPTKVAKHPAILVTPDVHGLTTALLDAAIRFAHQGFEVMLPDIGLSGLFGPPQWMATRSGLWARRGVPMRSAAVGKLLTLYEDALAYVRTRPMVDPDRSAVFGLSYGAAFAVGVAARDTKLAAVVLADPVPVDPPEWWKLLNAPVLTVSGGLDRTGAKAAAQLKANAPKGRLETFSPGRARAGYLARDLSAYSVRPAEISWDRMGEFLAEQLLAPPPKPPTPPVTTSPPPMAPKPPAPAAPASVAAAPSAPAASAPNPA
jgi:dienelactone hydrolase